MIGEVVEQCGERIAVNISVTNQEIVKVKIGNVIQSHSIQLDSGCLTSPKFYSTPFHYVSIENLILMYLKKSSESSGLTTEKLESLCLRALSEYPATTQAPQNGIGYRFLAELCQLRGDEVSATQYREQYISFDSDGTILYETFLVGDRQASDISLTLETICKVDDPSSLLCMHIGLLYDFIGNTDTATMWLRRSIRIDQSFSNLSAMGILLHAQGQLNESISSLINSLSKDLDLNSARIVSFATLSKRYLCVGKLLFDGGLHKQPDETGHKLVIKAFLSCLSIHRMARMEAMTMKGGGGGSTNPIQTCLIFFLLGRTMLDVFGKMISSPYEARRGWLYGAETCFRYAVQANSSDATCLHLLGDTIRKRMQFSQCSNLAVVGASPRSKPAFVWTEEAIDAYRRAAQLEPMEASHWGGLACALMTRGDLSSVGSDKPPQDWSDALDICKHYFNLIGHEPPASIMDGGGIEGCADEDDYDFWSDLHNPPKDENEQIMTEVFLSLQSRMRKYSHEASFTV